MAKKKPHKAAAAAVADPSLQQVAVTVECPLHDSFRVQQVAGMFDVTPTARLSESFAVDLPRLDAPWQIGVIVGPSGSGKSTIARQAFGSRLYTAGNWPGDRAIIDCFEASQPGEGSPELRSIKQITALLTSVGFSSPPAWLKPYGVLSNGQQFRCDLARSLIDAQPLPDSAERLVVFDEFTSVVDRQVAKVGSAAVSKHVRRLPGLRFVAVTCHYDIVEWLEPDWVLDMASGQLARGRLRRPQLTLDIHRGSRATWHLLKKHHYMTSTIPGGSRIYAGLCDGALCGVVVVAGNFGKQCKDYRRISRIVVAPDYQGVGIGSRLLDAVAALVAAEGLRVGITTAHPGMIQSLKHSPHWRVVNVLRSGTATPTTHTARRAGRPINKFASHRGRSVVSARYVGPVAAADAAALSG